MHLPINVKSPNNISKWQMGFNSAFKGLKTLGFVHCIGSRKYYVPRSVTFVTGLVRKTKYNFL
jgi:hypothetical protein